MKNAINYYYSLNPDDIHQTTNGVFKFVFFNNYYSLTSIEDISNIENIYKIYLELKKRGIYTLEIVLNNNNQIITFINNKNYVLLKSYGELMEKIKLEDIIYFSNITSNIFHSNNDWYNMWSNKMDYFEYQINQTGKKYPLLKESFSYFLGIVENGISLLINNNFDKKIYSICHKRIKSNDTLFDLYNPLNFVIDLKERDIAEYFKEYLKYNDPYNLVINYINSGILNQEEIKMFFIRMFYPSFYFDSFEKVIESDISEDEIKKSIALIDSYEQLLKRIYIYLKHNMNFDTIEWLN